MIIAFHVYHFTFRGTENAVYDYANYNEIILGNKSIIISPRKYNKENNVNVVLKFFTRFKNFLYSTIEELEKICTRENVNVFYVLKYGTNDGIVTNLSKIKSIIHCVYRVDEPHGTKYIGVSESISPDHLSHIIELPEYSGDLRKELNIPKNSIVFGRHGGKDTFNLGNLSDVIINILKEREDIYFIFMPRPIILENINHPRIRYLYVSIDPIIKRKFIDTCDCMIHSQVLGETQGISVLEFSYCNKPVLTWNGGNVKQHLKNLGEKAIVYNSLEELYTLLKNIKKEELKGKNWRTNILDEYTPKNIMKKFKELCE